MKNPDKITGDQMLNWLNSLHKWDGGIRNPEYKNDVRNNNWALINKFPLAKLQNPTGYVPDEEDTDDPYNRVIDPDMDHAMQTDLLQPIVVSSDRTTVLDGNHRVAKAREMGKTHLPAYIPETKLDFQLIDKEISEARLYRTTSGFNQLTGESVSELLYLNTLITFLMYKDEKQQDYAKAYAKQSTQYGKYTLFRSHATDLYLLAYVASNPDTKSVKLRSQRSSRKYLENLNFDKRTHWQFMFKLANGRITDTVASPYMFRLESQLKIRKSMYKQWRRLIMDWENLRYIQRQSVTARIVQELRRLGRGSEVMTPLTSMLKYKRYRVADVPKKVDPMRRLAGTAAGAVAGRYVGKKIGQKFNKNVDKYKKAGTGLGAIAGYWASGRQRQK
jgi:hypothetical protein